MKLKTIVEHTEIKIHKMYTSLIVSISDNVIQQRCHCLQMVKGNNLIRVSDRIQTPKLHVHFPCTSDTGSKLVSYSLSIFTRVGGGGRDRSIQEKSLALVQKDKVSFCRNTCFCSRNSIASCKQVKIPSAAICFISSGSGCKR